MHATTHYSVIDRVAHKAAWVSLKPVTGRQHQHPLGRRPLAHQHAACRRALPTTRRQQALVLARRERAKDLAVETLLLGPQADRSALVQQSDDLE